MEKCSWCGGTGKFKQPKDVKKYEELFDRYDAPGTLTMGECRDKALKEVGYYLIECPNCGGTGKRKPSLNEKILNAVSVIDKSPNKNKNTGGDGGPTKELEFPHSKENEKER